MRVERLDWDSEFFGYNIAQITSETLDKYEMEQVLEWCSKNQIKLLQFKCDTNNQKNIALAETNDFSLVDVRLVLDKKLNKENIVQFIDNKVRTAAQSDKDILKDMSKGLFKTSRYYYDLNFDVKRIDTFYMNWISKAVDSSFDDGAFVYEDENTLKGFVTYRLNHNQGVISLIGVDAEYMGQGIASALISAANAYFMSKGVVSVQVVTQGRNIEAQRLYQRNGFLTKAVQAYYHKWF